MNVDVDLKRDVEKVKVKVSFNAMIGHEFKEIFPSKDFNPCEGGVEDEFVKYALDQIEKFGNLRIACPMKAVITASRSEIQLNGLGIESDSVSVYRNCNGGGEDKWRLYLSFMNCLFVMLKLKWISQGFLTKEFKVQLLETLMQIS